MVFIGLTSTNYLGENVKRIRKPYHPLARSAVPQFAAEGGQHLVTKGQPCGGNPGFQIPLYTPLGRGDWHAFLRDSY
jgi:hypothetical protein